MRHQGNMNLLTGQRERDQKKSPKKMPYPQQILRNCQVGANSVKYYAQTPCLAGPDHFDIHYLTNRASN